MSVRLRITRRGSNPSSLSGLQMRMTSSPPAAAQTAHGRQSTRFPLLRQLFAALLFDLGLCYSGRHYVPDRSARAMCCNGWRPSWAWFGINGKLRRVASWRPVNCSDPLFPWENPSRRPSRRQLEEQYGRDWSTEQRLERLWRDTQGKLEPDYAYRARLSLIDAHIAGGGAL